MAKYVDGFIVPVPKKNLAKYKKIANQIGKILRKYGAIEYIECVADDVKKGKITSFPRSVKLKSNEVVIFSYVVYKSRAQRDAANKKMMKDPKVMKLMNHKNLPFDGKRMFFGGFKTIVSL